MAEAFVPGVPLFHCFGRIGCFMAGCCYGIPTEGPLGITFTHSIVAPNGVSLLPIQLIEAGANVITFIILLVFKKKLKRPLQNFGLYLLIYSIERFILNFSAAILPGRIFERIHISVDQPDPSAGGNLLPCRTSGKNVFIWILGGRGEARARAAKDTTMS